MFKAEELFLAPRPGCSFGDAEQVFEHFQQSLKHGHGVAGFKCSHCSLEFILLTWKQEKQITDVVCPECGQKTAVFLGYKRHPGPIFEHFAELCYEG